MKRLFKLSIRYLLFAVLLGNAYAANAQCSGMTFTARDYQVCEDNSVLVFLDGAPAKSELTWHFGNQVINANGVDSVRFIAINTGTFSPYVTVKTPANVTCRVNLPTGKSVKVLGKPKKLDLVVSPDTHICELGGLTKIEVVGGTSDMKYTFGVETLNGASDDNFYRSISASPSLTRRYYVEGYKSVIVEIRNGNGCRTIIKEDSLLSVSDLPVPKVSFKNQNDCDKKEIDFKSDVGNADNATYDWSFEGANPSSAKVPDPKNIVFKGEGKYDVMLTVSNGQGCSRSINKKDWIVIGEQKVIDLSISESDVCTNEELVIRQTGSDLSNGTVSWRLNGAEVSFTNIANTVKRVSYSKTGNYDVGLSYNMGGCITEVEYKDTIRVDEVKANFTASAYCNCYPEEVTFTNKSTSTDPNDSLRYSWTIKDQNDFVIHRSTNETPSYQFTQMGEFKVELEVAGNKGCTSSKSADLKFSPLRAAFSMSDNKACLGETVTATINPNITCLNEIEEIKWTLIDSKGQPVDSQSTEQFDYNFKTPGKYALELYLRNKTQCEDVNIKYYAVEVYQLESQVFTNDTFVCANDQVELEMKNGPFNVGSSNSWLIIDSTSNARFTGTGNNLNFKITEPGTFDVLMIASRNNFCADTVLLKNHFKVSGAKADIVTHKRESCVPFDDYINAVLLSNIQHRDTNYRVNYEWSSNKSTGIVFDDKYNDTTDIEITKSENYDINLKLTNNEGCITYFTKKKAYEAGVVSRFSANSTACVNIPLQTNNRSYVNANKYKWLATDTNVVIKPKIRAEDPRIIFKKPGKYSIGLVAENDLGCIDTSYKNINVIEFNFNFFSDQSNSHLCAPALVEFEVEHTNVDSFVWMFGDGDTLTTSDSLMGHFYDILDLNPNNEYPFNVKLIGVSKYGCQDTLNIDSFIKLSGPRPKFYPKKDVGTNELDVEFVNLNEGVRYFLMDYGDNSSVDSNALDTHKYVLP
ncbi:MAG: PKD domain-containing protein, partial [Bacteroidia bacterium]